MTLARSLSVAVTGVAGHVIEIEADLSPGLPGLTFSGLPDASVTESRDRIRAAVLNCGLSWPGNRITVALFPADLRKNGSAFDLAVALAVLAAAGALPADRLGGIAWLGELGLDGRLHPVRGALVAVLAARAQGVRTVVVPADNAGEAALVAGLDVRMADTLLQAVHSCRRGGEALEIATASFSTRAPAGTDLSDVVGQPVARRALEIAAAGAHHLMLQGVPGAGKTMLAERLPGILPTLDDAAALEVTAIHSVAGVLAPGTGLIRQPPLQAPHHSASMAALVGGGSGIARPGAASLAHRGVLVLDEAAEFAPGALESLRQPLESGRIVLHRSSGSVTYPARFQLVLATNPCPCGASRDVDCRCTPDSRRRYRRRLSGPLLDRVDLQIPIDPVARGDLMGELRPSEEDSATVGARVQLARSTAAERWSSSGWLTNAEIPGAVLRAQPWRPPRAALRRIEHELDTGTLSARGCDRVLRLAWTITDLAGKTVPGSAEVSEAVWLRTGRAS
jgi:magnesium chelatase family protein